MIYFIGFLAACAAWVALVYFLPRLVDDIEKAFKDKAKYMERLANPPPCRECVWCEPYENMIDDTDLDRCTSPHNPWKYAETFRQSECGNHAKYFKEVK